MSNNRMKPKKQVRNIKGQDKPVKREIPVNHGNAPILMVQLLNSINDHLIDIKKAMKNG